MLRHDKQINIFQKYIKVQKNGHWTGLKKLLPEKNIQINNFL